MRGLLLVCVEGNYDGNSQKLQASKATAHVITQTRRSALPWWDPARRFQMSNVPLPVFSLEAYLQKRITSSLSPLITHIHTCRNWPFCLSTSFFNSPGCWLLLIEKWEKVKFPQQLIKACDGLATYPEYTGPLAQWQLGSAPALVPLRWKK